MPPLQVSIQHESGVFGHLNLKGDLFNENHFGNDDFLNYIMSILLVHTAAVKLNIPLSCMSFHACLVQGVGRNHFGAHRKNYVT